MAEYTISQVLYNQVLGDASHSHIRKLGRLTAPDHAAFHFDMDRDKISLVLVNDKDNPIIKNPLFPVQWSARIVSDEAVTVDTGIGRWGRLPPSVLCWISGTLGCASRLHCPRGRLGGGSWHFRAALLCVGSFKLLNTM